MINYTQHTLSNGLTLIVNEDHNTPLCTVNLLYNVGARDEDPNHTGFAHLFEHLMFGGTKEVPDYDLVVDGISGENNAFTNNDYTNYYLTFPAEHLETAFYLEADRMRLLDFSQKSLDVQRQVVTEEYHQRYENQPYGDLWMLLRPLCYKRHPYRWNTIGATIEHVQQATIQEVEDFFFRYYRPDNCVLAVAGNVKDAEVLELAEKYFGSIVRSDGVREHTETMAFSRHYDQEEPQTEARRMQVHRPVPSDSLVMAFPMCARNHPDYYAFDIISDILSNGSSSRMYKRLVKEQQIFVEVSAYISGETDCGLFIVNGKLHDGVTIAQAEEAVWKELRKLQEELVSAHELTKVVNKFESTYLFSQYKAADRALGLCYFYWLGKLDWINTEPERYKQVSAEHLQQVARMTFRPENCSVLEYLKQE